MDIEGFQIEEVIGRGGMGSVFRARQLSAANRVVALKVIHPALTDDEEFRSRFSSEMRLVANLEHPNVIPVYEINDAGGQPYIAMALISGQDLGSRIRSEGSLNPEEAVSIVSQVASALDTAHERKIVHRDVKPANVLIDQRTGHVYLSDFGIAKSLEASRSETRTGQGLGSLQYISPEQLEGRPASPQSDIYSLGCVFLQCLTGETPFTDGPDAFILRQKLDRAPRLPSEVRPELGAAFDSVCQRALREKPEERFQSAGELALAARAALKGESTMSRAGATATSEATNRLRRDQNDPTRIQLRPRRVSGRYRVVGWLCLSVLVLAVVGFALSRDFGDTTDSEGKPASVAKDPESGPKSPKAPKLKPADSQKGTLSKPVPASPAETVYWSGYIAQLGSHTTLAEARSQQAALEIPGVNVGLLASSDYVELVPGYWVVYAGPFSNQGAAEQAAEASGVSDGFARYVTRR
jgi:serine/threonine protein kinase